MSKERETTVSSARGALAARRTRVTGIGAMSLNIAALFFLSASGAPAQQIEVTINGAPVTFQGMGPQQMGGRVLVPVRGVLEKLGAEVGWVPQTQMVVASSGNIDIQLHLGDRQATVNGRTVLLDVPAQEIAGHTMVPLRFLSEALGANVSWNGQTHTVQIVTSGQPNAAASNPSGEPTSPANNGNNSNAAPNIDALNQDANGWLHAGETLHVTMEGTPGGQAAFRIPGLVDAVPMQESSPGHYTGSWQVPSGKAVQLSNAAVIGELKRGNRAAPLLQAGQTLSVDATPPTIRDRGPTPDAHVTNPRPNIYAAFEDQGSGVDPGSVRLIVNGHDVTADAEVTPYFLSYTPSSPMSSGTQTVQLSLADKAGNKTQSDWKFTEGSPEASGIKAVTDNTDHTLEPGDTLHVEMTGTSGGKGGLSIGNIQNVPMREDKPGHYVADYTIRKGDTTAGPPLYTSLAMPSGRIYVHQSERAVQINAGKPMTPIITSPTGKETVSSPLVIKGKGTPNTHMHVKVDYKGKVLGVLALQGTAADTVVDVDKNGNWQTDPINLNGLISKTNVDYTITATSVNNANEESDAATLKFHIH